MLDNVLFGSGTDLSSGDVTNLLSTGLLYDSFHFTMKQLL